MWIDEKAPTALKQRISFGKEIGGGGKLVPGPEDTEFSQLCRNREGPGIFVSLG